MGLVRDATLYTAANLASRLASLGALMILPLLLDIKQYGVIGLVVAGSAFVNIVVPLEVSQGLARFYARTDPSEQPILAGTAWWFTVAMLTGTAILAVLWIGPLSVALFGVGHRSVFAAAVVFWWGNCAFLFLQNQFRWSFRTRQYAVFSLAYAGAMLTGAVALAAISPNALVGALVGWGIAAVGVTGWAFVKLRHSLANVISPHHLRTMLRFALPLVPASIALVVTTYFSRVALSGKVGMAEVGLFTFASQLASIPSFVVLGLQSAVTPYVMANFERDETPSLLARLFELVVLVGLAGAFALSAMSDSLLPILGYQAYAGAGHLTLFLGPALLLQQLYIFAPGFAIAHRTTLQAAVSISTGALAVALNFILIDAFGIEGAALATLAAAIVFILSWIALSQRFYRVPIRWAGLCTVSLLLAAASQAHSLLAQHWWSPLIILAAIGAVILASAPFWWPAITALMRRDSEHVKVQE